MRLPSLKISAGVGQALRPGALTLPREMFDIRTDVRFSASLDERPRAVNRAVESFQATQTLFSCEKGAKTRKCER
jgi:hypothetical protein